jgi:adenylate cyclase
MRSSHILYIATLLASVAFSVPAFAQSNSDYAALIGKTNSGEFKVEGAIKVDHAAALELHSAGVAFIDVRSESQYKQGHISGATSLELSTKLSKISMAEQFSLNQKLVFYCSDAWCYRSARASAKAITWGYTDVVYYSEGWSIWLAKGYPTE